VNQWSTDEPIPGKDGFVNLYWLSIAPDKRHEVPDLPAVVRCEVWAQEGGSLCWIPRKYCMQLTHSALVGALWRPVEAEPADPFEPSARSNTAPVRIAARDKRVQKTGEHHVF
jgi:hypothetical protein